MDWSDDDDLLKVAKEKPRYSWAWLGITYLEKYCASTLIDNLNTCDCLFLGPINLALLSLSLLKFELDFIWWVQCHKLSPVFSCCHFFLTN